MSTTDYARLADGFPAPDLDAWTALAERGLKGAALETLTRPTADGLPVDPLYAPAAVAPVRAAPAADPARPWDVRAVIDHPDPGVANGQALEALAAGAHSLLLRLDPTGRDGIAVADQDALARVLDGVLLDLAPVALDAGLMGPQAANALAVAAKGAPNAPLVFDLDPVSAFAVMGESPGEMAGHLSAAAACAERHAGAYPKASLFLASGRFVHEAGGSDAQMLGAALASAVAAFRALDAAGVSPDRAAPRLRLGLALDQRFHEGIALMRAARLCWARLLGVLGLEGSPARIDVLVSRRMLAGRGAHTNLLRQTAAAFAAACGGAESVSLDPFTRSLGGSMPLARRQALAIQWVLMEEAGLGRVADPAGGSGLIEHLTDGIARAAWAEFQRIEGEGGLVAALVSGALQDRVAAARDALMAEVRSGARPMLGVSLHRQDAAPEPVEPRSNHAVAPPDLRQAGPDSRCRPLTPIRLEDVAEASA